MLEYIAGCRHVHHWVSDIYIAETSLNIAGCWNISLGVGVYRHTLYALTKGPGPIRAAGGCTARGRDEIRTDPLRGMRSAGQYTHQSIGAHVPGDCQRLGEGRAAGPSLLYPAGGWSYWHTCIAMHPAPLLHIIPTSRPELVAVAE